MDTCPLSHLSSDQYGSPNLKLTISKTNEGFSLDLHVLAPVVHTSELPDTFHILQKHLPRVLTSECFNDAGLPFKKEVRSTEIGHLFEHILLQHLCEAKLSLGFQSVTFSGFTSWNWKITPRGKFRISLDISARDFPLLSYALPQNDCSD